jgi:hypothetical protein
VTDNIINNDSCVCILVDFDAGRCCQRLPLTVDVMNEVNEGSWAVGRSKRHNCISPFDCIRALKC